jgi:hypothetical protein
VRGSSVEGERIFRGWMKEKYQLQVRKYTTFPALFCSDHRGREGYSFTFRRVEGGEGPLYILNPIKICEKGVERGGG